MLFTDSRWQKRTSRGWSVWLNACNHVQCYVDELFLYLAAVWCQGNYCNVIKVISVKGLKSMHTYSISDHIHLKKYI